MKILNKPVKNQAQKPAGKSTAVFISGFILSLIASASLAQYDSWSAPRLLSEYRQMLVGMDRTIKDLDRNIEQADALRLEKIELDKRWAEINEMSATQEQSGAMHNSEVARFNSECLETVVTSQEQGEKCNTWSETLNARSAELKNRLDKINLMINEYNARIEVYNTRETARAEEAATLDRAYDEFENNMGRIDSSLARMAETRDIYSRCAKYKSPETRQECMQTLWNGEN